MNDYIKGYVAEKLKDKKAGIFGTGKKAYVAEEMLHEIDTGRGHVYFDNDAKKIDNDRVLPPSEITKGYFILVSTIHFQSIQRQLEMMGMKEMEDYIWVLDLDYYDAVLKYKDEPKVPDLTFGDLENIEKKLMEYTDVISAGWFDEKEFENYEETLGFQKEYSKGANKRYRRKIMEYYCADRLLGFNRWGGQDIYVDVGACGSPFARHLRERRGIAAYAVDLSEGKYADLPYYIKEDATKMHFKDGTVRGMSAQSAFEMFAGNADVEFVREIARCLSADGKAVICPLYMHRQYLSTVSPNYYHTGTADEGSLECIRTDCRGAIPVARFYDAEALDRRILRMARECGLKPTVYSLPQGLVEKDGFVYLKFILCLEKG